MPTCPLFDDTVPCSPQFSVLAPDGLLPLRAFTDLLQDLSLLSHGTQELPDAWLGLTNDKVGTLGVVI